MCGFPLEILEDSVGQIVLVGDVTFSSTNNQLVVRCNLVVGDLLCSSTNDKLAVWVGDLGWDTGQKGWHLFWNHLKKHTFIGPRQNYFLMSQAPLSQIIDRGVIYHCPRKKGENKLVSSTGDPIKRNAT